jgi:hypothetical protein
MSRYALISVAIVLGVGGCGGGGSGVSPLVPTLAPTIAPAIMNVAGIWPGTYSSAQSGFGRATLTLSQSGSTIGGTWSTTPDPGGGSAIGAGTVSGTMKATGNSGMFVLTLSPSDPRSCPFSATMLVFLAQRQLTGNWATVTCTVTANGTLSLSKTG